MTTKHSSLGVQEKLDLIDSLTAELLEFFDERPEPAPYNRPLFNGTSQHWAINCEHRQEQPKDLDIGIMFFATEENGVFNKGFILDFTKIKRSGGFAFILIGLDENQDIAAVFGERNEISEPGARLERLKAACIDVD